MTRTTGKILEFEFEGYQYNLAVITYNNIPSVVFVTYKELEGCWRSVEIPNVLKKFPKLLEQFVHELAQQGFTLLAIPEEESSQG